MANGGLTNIGLKAMAASYAGLQVTGHNIANASVKGYSRQQVELSTSAGQWSNGAFYGHGVDVSAVVRSHDEYLTREATSAQSVASMDSARTSQLQGLEQVFPTGENGLGNATSAVFAAMVDVSSNPGDLSARQVVLARVEDMTARFNEAGKAVDALQAGVLAGLKSTVETVNGLTTSIADVNKQIAALQGLSQPANDLLDQRDQLVAKLSEQIKVARVDASDGTTSLFIAGGLTLVSGINANKLQVTQDASDPTRGAIALPNGTTMRNISEDSLGGGALTGLLKFQNQDLVQGRNLIGRMAAAAGMALNAQQQRGITLQPPLGQAMGSPYLQIGTPNAVPNAYNAKDAAGLPVGSVALTVTDPSALQASDYELRESPTVAGTWQLTRLSDGTSQPVVSGQVVDGVQIDLNNVQPGDRFLLKPVGSAALGMRSLLSDPRDVAAASPLVVTTAAANVGTATPSSLQITASPLPVPGGSAKITFTDNLGAYTWTVTDSAGAAASSGSGTWQAGQPIPTPPQDINGFSLQINGVPKAGDELDLTPTTATSVATNNGNALSVLGLQQQPLVAGHTVTDAWAQAMSDIGVRVQTSTSASTISTAVAEQAEQSRSSSSGVSLDEEAAQLIQFQQSYQAAAKVLTVAQSIFDTLLSATAR